MNNLKPGNAGLDMNVQMMKTLYQLLKQNRMMVTLFISELTWYITFSVYLCHVRTQMAALFIVIHSLAAIHVLE